jgi:hypothetical protein
MSVIGTITDQVGETFFTRAWSGMVELSAKALAKLMKKCKNWLKKRETMSDEDITE